MAGAQDQPDRAAKLVTLARASSLQEADVLRAALGMNGIEAFIQGELAANTLSHLGLGLNPGGIQILVREADAPRAVEILRRAPGPGEARSDGKSGENSPQDESDEDPAVLGYARPETPDPNALARRAMLSAIFGLLVFGPLLLLSIYYAVRALKAAGEFQVEHPGKFRLHLVVVLVLVLPVVYLTIRLQYALLIDLLGGLTGG